MTIKAKIKKKKVKINDDKISVVHHGIHFKSKADLECYMRHSGSTGNYFGGFL